MIQASILFSPDINSKSADWYDWLLSIYHRLFVRRIVFDLARSTHGISGLTLRGPSAGIYKFADGTLVEETSFEVMILGADIKALRILAEKIRSEFRQESVILLMSKPDMEVVCLFE